MVKFVCQGVNGTIIGLGFIPENFERLKCGQPICIPYKELALQEDGGILVVYPNEEFEKASGVIPAEWIVLKMGDVAMETLKKTYITLPRPGGEIVIFYGENMEEIRRGLSPVLGPNTIDLSPTVDAGQQRLPKNIGKLNLE